MTILRTWPRPRFALGGFLLSIAAVAPLSGQGAPAQPKPAAHQTLLTRWARDLSPNQPLPEYPRPQLTRPQWTNLNGRWDYALTDTSAANIPVKFDGKIVVPFAAESHLSGVEKTVTGKNFLWYQRMFRAPTVSRGERVLLHFGAVDWKSTVYVNGKSVGEHAGGFDPFTFDITDALSGNGEQTLVVRVWDPTDTEAQPRGKQTQNPQGIFYTGVSGIWQTVWLETVPATYVAGLTTNTDIDAGTVTVRLTSAGAALAGSARVQINASLNGKSVASWSGAAGDAIVLRIPNAKLWSPDSPVLYDLDVTLSNNGTRDRVKSYVGLRHISTCKDAANTLRLCLNHVPLFHYGPLDQGWWPDGLYTAPTDAALRFDIEQTKKLGFNMIRKHIKVEPARWYYYTDKLGVLVWQDMPSGNSNTPAGKAAFSAELARMIDNLRNYPSIVMWVPFNEGWGQHDTERVGAWVKQYDPTRLVNAASGWTDLHLGDVADTHVYPGPGLPRVDSTRALVLGEFGGLGLPVKGHTWVNENNWGYQTLTDTTVLGTRYRELINQLRVQISDGLAAAVYTQTTDVETEVNGFFTYDREVMKLPSDIARDHATLYQTPQPRQVIVATSWRAPQSWRYTRDTPDSLWARPDFNDQGWATGNGGFGQPLPPGYARSIPTVRTTWETPELWARRTFTVDAATMAQQTFYWRTDHMGAIDIYLNGRLAARFPQGTSGQMAIPFDSTARAALQAGTNTLAVYAHRSRPLPAMQFFDVGIDAVQAGAKPQPSATATGRR